MIAALPRKYDIQPAEDIRDGLEDLQGDTIRKMMEA